MADAKGITTAIVNIKGVLDKSVQKSVDKATKSMKGLKTACLATATAIGAGVVGATKYLVDLGNELDGAYDTIRIGTGATGEALEGLKDDFEKVFASLPTTSENASQAIADLNTRLGLSGKTLQDVSKQAIMLSENLGAGDLTAVIEKSSRAFQAWGVAEDEMVGKMDYLFKVSQSTGIGYTELAEKTQKYGATFQSLGYDFESASTLIGQFVKNGVDVDSTLAGMRTSLGKMTAQGKDAKQGFEEYYHKIRMATSETEAMSIASEIFGSKNGALMAKAIRDGKLEVGALTAELSKSTETIEGASFDTMDYAEKMQILKNKMKVALAPLANSVFDSINALMPLAEKGMEALTNIIGKLGKNLPDIIPMISEGVSKVMDIITQIMPTIENVISGVIDTLKQIPIKDIITSAMGWIKSLLPVIMSVLKTVANMGKKLFPIVKKLVDKVVQVINKVLPMVQKVIEKIFPAIEEAITAIAPIIEKVMDWIVPVIENVIDIVMPIIEGLITFISDKIDIISSVIQNVADFVQNVFAGNWAGAFENIKNIAGNAFEFLSSLFDSIVGIWENVIAKISERFPVLGAVLQNVFDSMRPVIENVKNIFSGLIDFVSNVFAGNWRGAWESVKSIFSNVFEGLAGIVKVPLNAVIGVVNKVIDSINGVGFTIPDWVPIVGGKAFSLDIPQMPMFAKGGIATTPSIVGEGGYPEYVITTDPKYREKNITLLAQASEALNATEKVGLGQQAVAGATSQTFNSQVSKLSSMAHTESVTNDTRKNMFKFPWQKEKTGEPRPMKFGLLSMASEALNAKADRVETGGNVFKIEFAPVINCASGEGVDIMRAIKERMPEFLDMIMGAMEAEREGAY